MLSKVNHWIEIAATAVDALLVLRLLLLKLTRTYMFITLACVLAVFFDGVALWLGKDFSQVFIYSRFLYAFVIPAAVFDVWEEIKGPILQIRQLAARRMGSNVIVSAVFGFIMVKLATGSDVDSDQTTVLLAILVWLASITASLAFLWSVNRLAKAKKVSIPNNTFVWLIFFRLYLISEIVACVFILSESFFPAISADILTLLLGAYGILLTAWCMWKLRPISSSVPSAPAQASLQ